MSDNFAASLSKAAAKKKQQQTFKRNNNTTKKNAATNNNKMPVLAAAPQRHTRRHGKENHSVYVLDEAYSWLPATIVSSSTTTTTTTSSNNHTVQVSVTLPFNWHHTTVLSPDSTVLDLEELTVDRLVRTVSLHEYPKGELPLQNLAADGSVLGKRDMADLPFLHEAAILYNLKERHYNQQPYTRVGDIVVAMNPFTWIHALYTEQTRNLYADSLIWTKKKKRGGASDDDTTTVSTTASASDDENNNNNYYEDDDDVVSTFGSMYDKLGFDPHVYETSCLAYRGLALERRNQTILVTGESGAGKTETVKIVMSHLATLEQTRPDPNSGSSNRSTASVSSRQSRRQQSQPQQQSSSSSSSESVNIVTRVLESSPVFEAFGNAKTLRNDNSSRFGKFTQLQFRVESKEEAQRNHRNIPFCNLAGSVCITYLLEKSRVVSHSSGERTYHIFYQLLSAPDVLKRKLWKHLDGTTATSFRYTVSGHSNSGTDGRRNSKLSNDGDNHSHYHHSSSESDAELWPRTLDALEVFQFQGDRLTTLLRALCVVLQLGNLVFEEDPTSEVEEGGTVIVTRDELAKLEDIIGIDGDVLERAMTNRILKTGYDEVRVQLRPSVAKESCDALAKEIYARIFDVLVQSINEYTQGKQEQQQGETTSTSNGDEGKSKQEEFGIISLLDIFGFERFQVNRFEQLCINYANEQLQHKYVLDNFKQVQEEYEAEAIEIFDFAVVDNSDILNLLEGRLGIIISLNEECVRPKGNDESFVYKVKIVHKEHDRLIDEKLHRKTEFGIRHFAGPVTYNASKFVERNTDKLPEDLLRCATQSTNDLIRQEFKALIERATDKHEPPSTPGAVRKSPVRRKKATNRTVLEKFRFQLRSLMNSMENTTTRYIRCIKPNDQMTPRLTDHNITMRQLECAGLVTAITISRESFPNKLSYDVTRGRFECLMTAHDQNYMVGVPVKDAVHYMLSNLLFSMVEEHANGTLTLPFACGNTRVYFRTGALEQLETKRLDYFTTRAVVIQKWIRRIQGETRYGAMRQAATQLQKVARRRLEYQRYQQKQKAVIFLETWVRGRQATKLVHQIRQDRAATLLQTLFRTRSKALQLLRLKKAATVVQRAFRTKEKRTKFTAKLAVAVEEARMDNKLLGLKHQVKESAMTVGAPKASSRTVNEDLLEEIERMFDYLRKEIFTLRGKNADLKAELRDAENDKRELISHAESAEAAASSSRLQAAQLTKTIQAQSTDMSEYRAEVQALRRQVKSLQLSNIEEAESVKIDYEKLLKEREGEIVTLQKTIKQGRISCDQEKRTLRDKIQKMEDGHVSEMMRMKDELRRTQDSHHDYLAKLMDVLETTHAARESETARISAELNAVKEEKDTQILALRREVENLRKFQRTDVKGLQEDMKSKVTEVTVMRRELEESSISRNQRTRRFEEVKRRLSAAVSPDNIVAITSARRTRGKKLSVVEEEALKMKKMIRVLGELHEIETNSQVKIDDETLRTIDSFMVAAEPNRMTKQLQSQIAHLEATNKLLKEEAKGGSGNCIRCEARDKRRMAKQRQSQDEARARAQARNEAPSPGGEDNLKGSGVYRRSWYE